MDKSETKAKARFLRNLRRMAAQGDASSIRCCELIDGGVCELSFDDGLVSIQFREGFQS